MKRYISLPMAAAIASIVVLAVGTTGVLSRAENAAARENLEKLKKTNACRECDLSGLTLSRMNLAGADLEGADLSMTKFSLSNLSGANLRNANLKGASFGGTDLGEADLRGADLRGASLEGAYLDKARIDGEFVTSRPYEDIGVSDVEKQVYVANPDKPKRSPEAREVKIAAPRGSGDSPHGDSVAQESGKSSHGEEGAGTTMTAMREQRSDALPAKKVMPVGKAIVEPEENAAQERKEVGTRPEGAVTQEERKGTGGDQGLAPENVTKTLGKSGKPSPRPPATVSIDETLVEGNRGGGAIGARAGGAGAVPVDAGKRERLTRLLDEERCYACDLSGLDLSGKNLAHVDLEQANLAACNLERVNLDNANLKGATLQNAILRMASLKNADLYKADLTGADLSGADVQGAKLDNANISAAIGLKKKGH